MWGSGVRGLVGQSGLASFGVLNVLISYAITEDSRFPLQVAINILPVGCLEFSELAL